MLKPELRTNTTTGKKSLIVFYDQARDDFMQAIAAGERFYGIRPGSVAVIAKPMKALDKCHR